MYTLYKFHFLNGISEINQLFDDNLIIWPAPVYLHLNIFEYREKGQYFLSLISESETHLLCRFITHRVKYFKPLFLDILRIMAYR